MNFKTYPAKAVVCGSSTCKDNSGFSTIKITDQCDGLLNNVNAYINSTLVNQRKLESEFWCMKPALLSESSYVTTPNGFIRALTADEVLGGHIKLSYSTNLNLLLPTPPAAELCKKAECLFGKKIIPGDTFEVHIVNDGERTAMLGVNALGYGSWSSYNSTDETPGILILSKEILNYWFRFTSCEPGSEAYEIIRPEIYYPYVSQIPMTIILTMTGFTADMTAMVATTGIPFYVPPIGILP